MRIIPVVVVLMVWSGAVGAQTTGPATGATGGSLGTGSSGFDVGRRMGQTAQTGQTGQAAGRAAWVIVPRIAVRETLTDNATLSSSNKKSDQITELNPGVRMEANTARLKMHLDYGLRGLYYAQGSRGDTILNALNAFGTIEALEKSLYVDVSGVIAQQTVSAFGSQSPGYYSVNSNTTETSNYRVSPYLRGRLGSLADYEARYSHSMVRSKGRARYDTDIDEWSGRINGSTPLAALGWSLDASMQQYDYSQGRKVQSDSMRGFLTYRVDPQLKVSLSAGRESNDFASLTNKAWNTNGYGFNWMPTERTQVSVFREKRFFGYGHTVSMSHRMPSSAVTYTDSRNVAALPNQMTTVGLGNIYDLLFAQLASAIPDPAERAARVNAFLNAFHISPNMPVTSGFLSSQVRVQRSQNLSWLWYGARNTLTLAFVRTQNDRLGTGLATGEDFSIASSITQKGINVGWSHLLSAQSSLNVSAARTRSSGVGTTGLPAFNQKMFSAGVTTKLGAKTNGAVTARRTEMDGGTGISYTENAVIGSVSMQF